MLSDDPKHWEALGTCSLYCCHDVWQAGQAALDAERGLGHQEVILQRFAEPSGKEIL